MSRFLFPLLAAALLSACANGMDIKKESLPMDPGERAGSHGTVAYGPEATLKGL